MSASKVTFMDRGSKVSMSGYEEVLAAYDVLVDGTPVGHVEHVESPCKIWRAYDLSGQRVGEQALVAVDGSRTRMDAGALLLGATQSAAKPRIILHSFDLAAAERTLTIAALEEVGSTIEAAQLLGVTTRRLASIICRHRIEWPAGYRPR